MTIICALILLTGCGGAEEAGSNFGASEENRAVAGTPAAEAEPARPAPAPEPAPAPAYVLVADGLEPGITFGMKQADALAAAAAAFGAAGKPEHVDECGERPMDFVSFGRLQLAFQEGKLAGWSLSGTTPSLRTKSGLTVGSPRSALGALEIDEDSTLGPEFDSKGVGGVLDENGAKVVALWAGLTCQFR